MANTVVLKRSAVSGRVPSTGDLALGEIAINTYDGNLFFKKDNGTASVVSVATLTGSQTLTNKTLSGATLSGTLIANGSAGTNGQVLTSTGTGVNWTTFSVSTLDSLTDVTISNPAAQQVLKYNGSQWINSANDVAVASAVFAAQAQTDLGYTYESVVFSEDLGFVYDTATFLYDLGNLRLDGIVSLENLDQSVKADYIAYSIIFGF